MHNKNFVRNVGVILCDLRVKVTKCEKCITKLLRSTDCKGLLTNCSVHGVLHMLYVFCAEHIICCSVACLVRFPENGDML